MAIETDDLIEKFGTQDEVTSSTANVSNDAYSSGLSWTNDDDAMEADVVLAAHFNTTPDANGAIHIHLRKLDIAETTGDEPVPSDDWQGGYVGTILVDDITTDQWPSIRVRLRNGKSSQGYEWYVENRAGQTLGDSAGSDHWRLFITPVALGAHA
jgi:hypothetical protein